MHSQVSNFLSVRPKSHKPLTLLHAKPYFTQGSFFVAFFVKFLLLCFYDIHGRFGAILKTIPKEN